MQHAGWRHMAGQDRALCGGSTVGCPESLAALDVTGGEANFLARIDQSVVEALVIAL